MSFDYEDQIIKSDSDIIYSEYIEYARITFGSDNSYFMKTEKITIGRNSADGNVDIDVGPHTFVSRKHLEVMYSYKKLKVKCLGKNGIFIDNYFKAHSSVPYELPYECTLRFPSTNVEVNVKQLVGRKTDDTYQDQSCQGDNSYENRQLNPKRKVQKVNEKVNYNVLYDIYKEIPLNIPLQRSVEAKEVIIIDNEIKSESILDQSNNFITNRKPSTTFIMSEPNIYHNNAGNNNSSSKLQNICIEKSIPEIVLSPRSYRSYSYNGDVIYTHNSQVFSSIYDSKDLAVEYGTDTQKPPYSYAQLIVQAVSSSRDRQLTLNGIYNYISKHYPYFKSHDKGWQNSVRHNLSLNRYFIKVRRGQDEPGKGSFWRVDGAYESKLIAQAYRKRRLRSNNCGSICSENIPSASRVFSLSSARPGNICTVSDRNAKLNNIFTLRRSNQKSPTAFVLRKMGDTSQLTECIAGSASILNKDFDLNNPLNKLTTENVFHNNKSVTTNSKFNRKRIFQSPISVMNKTSVNTNTLISIGGKVFSTNKLKPIQLVSTKTSTSFVPVKQSSNINGGGGAGSGGSSGNKYILISSSQIETTTQSHLQNNELISITGSGTLNQSDNNRSLLNTSLLNKQQQQPSLMPSDIPVIFSESHHIDKLSSQLKFSHHHQQQQPMSPLSVSESREFALDEPSQLDSSSTEFGPLSPSLRFSQSLHQDDDLDLEMDQFLDSYSILDHPNDIDSNPDMYKEEEDMEDYCIWQDEYLGLQDVEVEIH